MENRSFIPLSYNALYYLYDCNNKEIYPCSKQEYDKYVDIIKRNCSAECFSINDKEFLEGNDRGEYSFPEVSEKHVLASLSTVSHITLEITENCNMQCVYCCYGSLYKDERSHRIANKTEILNRLKTLLLLRKEINNFADLRISFYGGEPLLCFDIIKACVELSRNILPNVNLSFGMTTNGLLLKNHIAYLTANRFSIMISLDGNRRNNEYRVLKDGSESFDRVVESIDYVYCNYPIYFKENVRFSCVLHNKNHLLETLDFFSKWDKTPLFSLVTSSNAQNRDAFFTALTERKKYTKEELSVLSSKYPEAYNSYHLNKSLIVSKWQSDCDEMCLHPMVETKKYPGKSCFLFANKVFVTLDGAFYPCEKISRKYKFGIIENGKFLISQKQINDYYGKIQKNFEGKCKMCYKRFSCSVCFFAEDEEVEKGDCFCSSMKALEEINKLIGIGNETH